jgi:hypothetical protein
MMILVLLCTAGGFLYAEELIDNFSTPAPLALPTAYCLTDIDAQASELRHITHHAQVTLP